MNDILVWACQLHPKGGTAAPATGAAAAAEIRAGLRAAGVVLDEAAVAQTVVQHNGTGLYELAQFIAHHPTGEPAVLDVFLGQRLSVGDHLLLALLQPRTPVSDAAHVTLREQARG